jgi:hypothetical protein
LTARLILLAGAAASVVTVGLWWLGSPTDHQIDREVSEADPAVSSGQQGKLIDEVAGTTGPAAIPHSGLPLLPSQHSDSGSLAESVHSSISATLQETIMDRGEHRQQGEMTHAELAYAAAQEAVRVNDQVAAAESMAGGMTMRGAVAQSPAAVDRGLPTPPPVGSAGNTIPRPPTAESTVALAGLPFPGESGSPMPPPVTVRPAVPPGAIHIGRGSPGWQESSGGQLIVQPLFENAN